jgi:hypothetical protein
MAQIELAIEMRKRFAAARDFPAQRLTQSIGIDRDQEQPGLAKEVLAGRAFKLGRGGKMYEPVTGIVGAAAKNAVLLGLPPGRSRTDFVDRAHACPKPVVALS